SAFVLPWGLRRVWPRLSSRRLALVGLLSTLGGFTAANVVPGYPVWYAFLSFESFITYALAPTLVGALTLALVLATPRRDEQAPSAPSLRIGRLGPRALVVAGWFALAALVNLIYGISLQAIADPFYNTLAQSEFLFASVLGITHI